MAAKPLDKSQYKRALENIRINALRKIDNPNIKRLFDDIAHAEKDQDDRDGGIQTDLPQILNALEGLSKASHEEIAELIILLQRAGTNPEVIKQYKSTWLDKAAEKGISAAESDKPTFGPRSGS